MNRIDTKFQLRVEHGICNKNIEKTDSIIQKIMDIFRSENLTFNEAEYILKVCQTDLRYEARVDIRTDAK